MERAPRNIASVATLLLTLAGCSDQTLELRVAPRLVPQAIAEEISALSRERDTLDTIEVQAGGGALDNLEAVARGEADLAIVPNSVAHRAGVRSVAVLYEGVLHTLHRRSDAPRSYADLFAGAVVYAGPEGSVERWLLEVAAARFGIGEDYRVAEEIEQADVLLMFAPIMHEVPAQLEGERWQLFSLADAHELGEGTRVESVPLLYPQLQPFVIPARTYPSLGEEPVLTLSVEVLLVASEELDEHEVHALTRELVEQRRHLAENCPALHSGLHEAPDRQRSTFALHEGARQYFERDRPGFAERYAELIGVCFSMFVAAVSGLVAFSGWRRRRLKNRIDVYYAEVWEVRGGIDTLSPAQLAEAKVRLRKLEARAFQALIAEELAADEAFRIFVTLVNDTLGELDSRMRSAGR